MSREILASKIKNLPGRHPDGGETTLAVIWRCAISPGNNLRLPPVVFSDKPRMSFVKKSPDMWLGYPSLSAGGAFS